MKRTMQINVKLSPDDFQLLKRASEMKWPDAVMTNSGILLGLAKISARDILLQRRVKAPPKKARKQSST